ncbi:hypothetical protein CMUS01_10512 [Colletotrichum musicola]|uniref:Uncharacterized protein n=1 Tax=Colletotrichum musicola TaxID=2175873 RepID=A0A8H6K2J4_9PEZI|nr:hypothetical protein CMUS01_10512 [Colletotrichum musicola]
MGLMSWQVHSATARVSACVGEVHGRWVRPYAGRYLEHRSPEESGRRAEEEGAPPSTPSVHYAHTKDFYLPRASTKRGACCRWCVGGVHRKGNTNEDLVGTVGHIGHGRGAMLRMRRLQCGTYYVDYHVRIGSTTLRHDGIRTTNQQQTSNETKRTNGPDFPIQPANPTRTCTYHAPNHVPMVALVRFDANGSNMVFMSVVVADSQNRSPFADLPLHYVALALRSSQPPFV